MLATSLSIQRTGLFYTRNHHNFNLDGVFGIRIAEGVLANILKNHFDAVIKYVMVSYRMPP